VIENETVIAERDYRHLQTVIINPLNLNSHRIKVHTCLFLAYKLN